MPPTMIRNHDADTAPVAVVEPDAFGTPGVLDRLGAHMTRLVTDEDGMSTAEYSPVSFYTVRGCHRASPDRCPTVPRHRRYNLP
jgi:hypothetical protein